MGLSPSYYPRWRVGPHHGGVLAAHGEGSHLDSCRNFVRACGPGIRSLGTALLAGASVVLILIFPALEREVAGMKPGEEKKVELSPGEGFGHHDDRKKLNIPKHCCRLERKQEMSCGMMRVNSPLWRQ